MATFIQLPKGELLNLTLVQQVRYLPDSLEISFKISGKEELERYADLTAYNAAKSIIDSQIITS